MEVIGTKAAFLQMLSKRGVYKKLGVSVSRVSNWKRALAGHDDNNRPTLDKMEEMLSIYGARVAQEKVWEIDE